MLKRCRWCFLILTAAWLVLAVAGCALTPTRSAKVSPDWSRGLRLGVASLPQPAALAVNEAGTEVHLAWSAQAEERTALRYVRLDEQGRVARDEMLATSLFLPREPQLVLDGSGVLHLFCLARLRSSEPEGLFHLPIGQEGQPLAEPVRLSGADETVTSMAALADRAGQVEVFWAVEGGPAPGIYHHRLGQEPVSTALVVPQGEYPAAAVDAEGGMHLAWLQGRQGGQKEIRYAFFPGGDVGPAQGAVVASLHVGTGTLLQRPALGLDSSHVYIFWSAEYRGGLQAGSAETSWASFPLGRPDRSRTNQVLLPGEYPGLPFGRLPSPTWQARLTQRLLPDLWELPPEGVTRYSGFVYMPALAFGQWPELPVALSMMIRYRAHDYVQPVMALFQGGQLLGYQVAGRTRHFSLYPRLAGDQAGNLHLVWVDQAGWGNYEIIYATTAAAARAHLDRLDATDVLVGVVDTVWGMLSGLSLIPLLIPAVFVPLVCIVLYYIFGREDSLQEKGPRVVLLIALILYLGGKLLVLSPVFATVPLLDYTTGWLTPVMQWGSPVFVLALAVLALILYIRRAGRPSLFVGFLIFVLVDALLTLVLYGPGFFA
ncbi:MAG: hypothetical protein QHJ81_07960 [Anaerolineae bacterium]|nr:hypothetical protein [Anaerolineae bacterium]